MESRDIPRGEPRGGERREIVYCLVPRDLAEKLHEPLRKHFREDPNVEVIVERRKAERRSEDERRTRESPTSGSAERRSLRSATGRRVAERRAPLAPAEPPGPLPRKARPHADRIAFAIRSEPAAQEIEDADTQRLVARTQAGDERAFGDIYVRYFDRVFGYLLVALRNHHTAEDVTHDTFTNAFAAIGTYQRRGRPFRAWLFRIARNCAIDVLRKEGKLEPVDPAELAERIDAQGPDPEDEILDSLNWISDREMVILIERLPQPQRQAIVLRNVLCFANREIAEIMERQEGDVRALQTRGLRFLRKHLSRAGRVPDRPNDRSPLTRRTTPAQTLRARRYAL